MKNKERAIISGKIVTTHNGRRLVRKYTSGEKLQGEITQDDAPPYTGYVRGWFKGSRRN